MRIVATYIQSGNVVFNASPALAHVFCPDQKVIADRFDTRSQWSRAPNDSVRPCAETVPASRRGRGDAARRVSCRLAGGRQGQGARPGPLPSRRVRGARQRTSISTVRTASGALATNAYFDSKLATMTTVRNWKTVETLVELLTGHA
jgi:uncharacterized protein (DUF1697 family)